MSVTRDQIVQWLTLSAEVLEQQKDYLTQLDSAIGDADHGINMNRGFKKVMEKLPTVADQDIGNILKTTGMTLISSVGGASGPLYGTFFMRAGMAVPAKEELTAEDFQKMLEAGVEGIISRGRAQAGDKTMIDAWQPALEALKSGLAEGKTIAAAMDDVVTSAEAGLQATIPMQAKKGRASYLGERSIGHPDPGATSTTYILNALREAVQ